jgi:hypothetical protein
MFARPTVLLAALLLPATAVAQGFEYAPGTAQYRIVSKTHGAQEAMGQKNEFDTSNDQLLTVTVARQAKDTMAVTVTIDSLAVVGPMGMAPPGIDKLKGAKIATKMAPYGVVYSSVGPKDDSIPQGAQITDELSRFLPRIRAKLASGATWSDTTTGKVTQAGIDVDRRTISKFNVVGDTTVGSQKAWKIARETATTLSGSGTSQGQPMTMEGTANGRATFFMSQSGMFLGGSNQDDAIIKIVLAANGMEIGVTTTANTTVEKIK